MRRWSSVLEIKIEKGHPPPQLAQFRRCGWGAFLNHLSDLEVAALITIAGFEHRHRAGVPDTGSTATVEAVHDQHTGPPP